MVKYSLSLILFLFLLTSCHRERYSLLIEAESFENLGGWVVDPQFVDQVGSTYLLAHGLGKPVKDSETRIILPASGRYHVWARTMDWAPGEWDSPGRFRIILNDKPLKNVLGTEEGWGWQYAGAISFKDMIIFLKLQDLTGFDGRCDAVFLSTGKKPPPDEPLQLSAWRKSMSGESETPSDEYKYDLIVVGGGIAGCAASIAAAEQGMKVALIHDRPVLGGNASSEIRVHTEGITWKSDRILSMLNTVWWPNGSPDAVLDDKKRHDNMEKYENIDIYLNFRAYSVDTLHSRISAVDARHTSGGSRIRFTAPFFIDCTGDGWIGYWAGAEYMYGREDSSQYGENLPQYGELWSPGSPDNRVMGSSVLWLTSDAGKPVVFPDVPWASVVAADYAATSGTWKWEYSTNELHQIDDAEQIRDHMLKAIYGSFSNAKKDERNGNLKLEWVSYLVGKRESRRLTGDYIYTFTDEREMREFPDAVVMEKRNIDVHYQQILKDSLKPDFLSEALYYKLDHYYIPFRSLYSKNIENLMMAGRCFSCSHVGLGGPRVMHTTGQMGVAVGYAASLCKKYNTTPRGIYSGHISELRQLIGAE
ncbi:MAG TPA: FAD-dependent oxidoreductase [Bacteroidales bacterium]|nr:FAD-dependent oxidoreductase [Bacteroidales bacterium]HPJ59475.1 FAD-dependent oxidoreductase [Bacteroidales bacterium]HPR12858.1 FAD-dependent oxidoreductase [Bacteroidales bacterium]HRW85115.1 FAD-dependent oxidoreductase [Bacteroidales bacterium]